jgi:hypothetical protein
MAARQPFQVLYTVPGVVATTPSEHFTWNCSSDAVIGRTRVPACLETMILVRFHHQKCCFLGSWPVATSSIARLGQPTTYHTSADATKVPEGHDTLALPTADCRRYRSVWAADIKSHVSYSLSHVSCLQFWVTPREVASHYFVTSSNQNVHLSRKAEQQGPHVSTFKN